MEKPESFSVQIWIEKLTGFSDGEESWARAASFLPFSVFDEASGEQNESTRQQLSDLSLLRRRLVASSGVAPPFFPAS
nr:hypothetical protein Iba_scaffold17528.3CG0090 [Ipomoea batatas]